VDEMKQEKENINLFRNIDENNSTISKEKIDKI